MSITAPGARRLAAVAVLASSAALVTACGSSPGPAAPAKSVTVTFTPTASPTQPAPSPSSSAPVTPSGPPECTSADLKIALGSSNGAAGTIYYNIDFTNTSSGPCFLQGYPGVSLVSAGDGSGTQIGADAKRAAVTPSHQIVLNAGQAANAALGVAEAGNFPASTCKEVTAHWLKVFPPDQTVAAYVALTTQTCSTASVATMHISAITSGA
jgi:hypothetical protein